MSQDIVSDGLNQIMNMKRAGKKTLTLAHYSKLLLSVLAVAKLRSYLTSYRIEEKKLVVEIGKLNGCQAIKPRYVVTVNEIDKYVARYLPAKNLGILILSTSQGLMTHQTAIEKNIGGSLIAYMF